MKIRPEEISDQSEVHTLIKEAFETAEHSDGNEQDLVMALRKSESYLPKLSLIAEINKEIVGHIMFTKANIGENEVLVLAPLSVKVNYQKQHIGTKLINESHKIAKELGYEYSIVIGSDLYYPKFGYVPAEDFGITVPEGIPSKNFMAIKLLELASPLKGEVIYAKEFGM